MFALIRTLLVALLVGAPFAAVAQDKHDHGAPGPNGGKMEFVSAARVELEMVVKDRTLQIYLYDDKETALSVQGAEMTATVQMQGKRETIKLQQAGPNLMQGEASAPLAKGMRAVIAVKLPGKPAGQARFTH